MLKPAVVLGKELLHSMPLLWAAPVVHEAGNPATKTKVTSPS
jgi:hypothetical protein